MTIYLRRNKRSRSETPSSDAEIKGPISPPEFLQFREPPNVAELIQNPDEVLRMFGRSDYRLQKETKLFGQMLTEFDKPLTEKLDAELTEWECEFDLAKKNRCKPREKIDLIQVLIGAVQLKRYNLYLSTQISELLPQP